MSEVCLEHLDEWYDVCTIEKCGSETAHALSKRARVYFSLYLSKVGNPLENPDGCNGGKNICWHLLELRLNTGTHRSGKHYKNWLFDYSRDEGNPAKRLSSIKSGMKLMFQATVRDYCAGLISQNERDRRYGVCSFDDMDQTGEGCDDKYMAQAQALLEDDAHVQATCVSEAEELADALIDKLDVRQRIILLVKCCEANRPRGRKVSLDHPIILAAAGCGKSQLYAARNGLDVFLRQEMQTMLKENRHDSSNDRVAMVSVALAERLSLKMKSEKRYEAFLTYLEDM